jgi:acyl-CoA synthetase (AMP-forming)/AMP-acid ligase II
MLHKIRAAHIAITNTGLLSPSPLLAALQLFWCLIRYGASLYAVASWMAWRFPERVALVEAAREVRFKQLVAGANALAQSLSLRPNQTVGLLGRNSVAYVETLLACGCSGADVLLLNTGFSSEQLLALAQVRHMDLLVCDREFEARVAGLLRGLHNQERSVPLVVYTDSLNKSGSIRQLRLPRRVGNLILLTSGTTGPAKMIRRRPKLGQLPGMLMALLNQLRPKAGQATLLTIPLFHGHGLATLGLCLSMGAPLYLFAQGRPDEYLRCIEEQDIKVLVLVPTVLYRLLEYLETHSYKAPDIQTIVCGSAPLDGLLATRALERFGPVLYNLYGSSETGVISLATPEDLRQAPATVGRVLPGVGLRILDPHLVAVAAGQSGQIWTRSPLTRGSTNTGDVGYLDSAGRLFLLGRQDDMLICGGEKIYPQAIEETVSSNLGYVLECAAIGVPDTEYGQAVHLFVVLKDTHADITPDAIAEVLKPLFPRATRPKKIILLKELPRNLAGKVLRNRLGESSVQ